MKQETIERLRKREHGLGNIVVQLNNDEADDILAVLEAAQRFAEAFKETDATTNPSERASIRWKEIKARDALLALFEEGK